MQLIYCCSYKGKPLLCRDCDNNFNMSKRVKGKKMCPADYDDAEESDSDISKDPDYLLQEPPSPKLSQDKGCAIVKLLKPFKECGEELSSENNVTISLIVPHFNKLRQHLSPCASGSTLIEDMKSKMLIKLNDRYTEQQIQSMTVSTLLDVRYKNVVKHEFDLLKPLLLNCVGSQNEIPATEGQELENLSAITSTKDKSIFAYDDDEDEQVTSEPDDVILCELTSYKNVRLSASEKAKINVLRWWQDNQKHYPHLFQLVRSNLHIPATSVPSERIFSLAGYIVRERRSGILSENVNKAIFLTKNAKHIPRVTTV